MSWADAYIAELRAGRRVSFRPFGRSMEPLVKSGQLCTVDPDVSRLTAGDVVLCIVERRQFLHLLLDVDGDDFLIGNNKGHINGWIRIGSIFGRLVAPDPFQRRGAP